CRPPGLGAKGLPVSLRDFLVGRDVQRLVGHQLLQPPVLLLQALELLHVVGLDAAKLRAPTVKRRLGDLQALADLTHRQALGLPLLRLAQLPDDLVRGVSLPLCHRRPPCWSGKGAETLIAGGADFGGQTSRRRPPMNESASRAQRFSTPMIISLASRNSYETNKPSFAR